ncbi:hypothetical protein PR202_gb29085 [Eleusine coracana subsp. coracana]|uniref:Protein kinase domain-containing protein n=1 Tax=Eleusine coracana subsp. coracana TaxID=191504 RepID=A0AAV5G0F5_ELECO|nr:hypothetical protein PR202_gb29085 [Eleusine coracana subsp. coracana]
MAPSPPPPPRAGEELQDWEEATGESSPPSRSQSCASQLVLHEVMGRIDDRLRRTTQELVGPSFKRRLYLHLQRLPPRYLVDHDFDDKADDVLLHWGILDECADPDKRPVFHARYIKVHSSPVFPILSITVRADCDGSYKAVDEPCEKLMEDLSLERRKTVDGNDSMSISSRCRGDLKTILLHEIVFSSLDKPKAPPSDSTTSSTSEKILDLKQMVGDSEIDMSKLTKGEKIASGSSADLYRGTYDGLDVAIKFLKIENLSNATEVEFLQEVLILRQVFT